MQHTFQLFDGYWNENFASGLLAMLLQSHEGVRRRVLPIIAEAAGKPGLGDLEKYRIEVSREEAVSVKERDANRRLDMLIRFYRSEIGDDSERSVVSAIGIEVKLFGYGQSEEELKGQLEDSRGWLQDTYPHDSALLYLSIFPPGFELDGVCNGELRWDKLLPAIRDARKEAAGFERGFLSDAAACLDEAVSGFWGFETLDHYAIQYPKANPEYDEMYAFLRALKYHLLVPGSRIDEDDSRNNRHGDGWDYYAYRITIPAKSGTKHTVGFYWYGTQQTVRPVLAGGYFAAYLHDDKEILQEPLVKFLARTAKAGWFFGLVDELKRGLGMNPTLGG